MGNKCNAGHIIIKGTSKGNHARPSHARGTKKFFLPHELKQSKPAFCYGESSKKLLEEVDNLEKEIKISNAQPGSKLHREWVKKKARADQVAESWAHGAEIADKDKDKLIKRHEELGKKIGAAMPSRRDVKEGRVSGRKVLRIEKQGLKGERPLQEDKMEYIITGRALQAAGVEVDSDISHLEREK